MKRDPLEDIGLDPASLDRQERYRRSRTQAAHDAPPKAAPIANQGLYDAASQSARGFPGGAWAPRVTASAKDQAAAGAGASMRADTFGASPSSTPGLAAAARGAAGPDLSIRDQMAAPPAEPAPVAPGILPPPVPAPPAAPSRAGKVLAFIGGAILGAVVAKAFR